MLVANTVMPAKAGIHADVVQVSKSAWTPAFAGVTKVAWNISVLARPRLAEIEAQPVPRRRALREGVVDDGVLEHALDVVAGLEEGDRFDPLHHVDSGKARVAVL